MISGRGKRFLSPQHPDWPCGLHNFLSSVGIGCSFVGGGVKLLRLEETLCRQLMPPHAFMARFLIKHRYSFTLYFLIFLTRYHFLTFPNAAEMMEIMCCFTLFFLNTYYIQTWPGIRPVFFSIAWSVLFKRLVFILRKGRAYFWFLFICFL